MAESHEERMSALAVATDAGYMTLDAAYGLLTPPIKLPLTAGPAAAPDVETILTAVHRASELVKEIPADTMSRAMLYKASILFISGVELASLFASFDKSYQFDAALQLFSDVENIAAAAILRLYEGPDEDDEEPDNSES